MVELLRVRLNLRVEQSLAMSNVVEKCGSVSFRINQLQKKPLEVRMGKGKGSVEYWVAEIKPGTILYEINGVPEDVARQAFKLAAAKLPVKSQFTKRVVM